MISGKRVIAAMLTALMAVTFTANTAVSVYATGVTATENAGTTIDAQSTDAQALTPEEQKASGIAAGLSICRWNRMDIRTYVWTWDLWRSRNCYGSRNRAILVCQEYRCS